MSGTHPCRLLHDDMKESGLLPVTGRLLKSFNFAFQPRSHAADLVQALHVILRMLDRLNTTGTCTTPDNNSSTNIIICYDDIMLKTTVELMIPK